MGHIVVQLVPTRPRTRGPAHRRVGVYVITKNGVREVAKNFEDILEVIV